MKRFLKTFWRAFRQALESIQEDELHFEKLFHEQQGECERLKDVGAALSNCQIERDQTRKELSEMKMRLMEITTAIGIWKPYEEWNKRLDSLEGWVDNAAHARRKKRK